MFKSKFDSSARYTLQIERKPPGLRRERYHSERLAKDKCRNLQTSLEVGLQAPLNGSHVLAGGDPGLTLLLATGQSKILGHDELVVDDLNAGALELLSESDDLGGVVELATLHETAGPGENGGNGVGGGLAALLVLAVVTGHGAVGSLGLEGLAGGGDEGGGHQTEGAEALGDDVGLDITVVVLQGHDEATLGLDHLGDHVIDETVLVPDLLSVEVLGVVLLEDLLEDILEAAIVLLEDGVLGAHVQGETLHESHLERGVGEATDGVISVVLALSDTTALEVVDVDALGLTTLGGKDELELTGAGDDTVLGTVLVTEGVTANNDGLVPARHQTGNGGDDDGLAENGTTTMKSVSRNPPQSVVDQVSLTGCYGWFRWGRATLAGVNFRYVTKVAKKLTLLQLEFLNTGLIGGDGCTLDTNTVLLDSLGGIDGDLVIGLVTVLKTLDRRISSISRRDKWV